MKTKLLQTEDYLLLIDEEADLHTEPVGTVYLHKEDEYEFIQTKTKNSLLGFLLDGTKIYYKIIAYYPLSEEAKELDLPSLPNPFEEEPLMKQASKLRELRGYHKDSHYSFCGGFIEGYRAAQSKQFSLEDMIKAFNAGRRHIYVCEANGKDKKCYCRNDDDCNQRHYITAEEYIQSLSTQQLPKGFIPEAVTVTKGTSEFDFYEEDVIKTITNSNGKKELVGVYKY